MLEGMPSNEQEGEEFKVTPWTVEGRVDYDKLIKMFGTEELNDELLGRLVRLAKEEHFMLARRIFFSHRDLNKVLDDYEAGRGFFLYTGRGPSGPMHVGHIIPFYFTKWLQARFKVNLYIEVTDDEKFLEEGRGLSYGEVKHWANENILDIAAVGLDPDRTFIFKDTEYIGNMYPLLLKIAKRINFSLVRAVFGFDNQTNIGLIFYPALQIAPTMFERRRCLIPSAIDQDPYWRIQRDISEQLNYYKTAAIHSKFLMPLTGPWGKMSSSSPETAIFLTDTPDVVRKKIWKAFSGGQPTAELQRKLGGNPDIDVAFQWLYYFFEPDNSKIEKIREDYRSGALLTGDLKEYLIEKVNRFLEEHQANRENAREIVNLYLRDGELASKMWKTIYGDED